MPTAPGGGAPCQPGAGAGLKRRADEVRKAAQEEQEDEAGEMRQLMSRGAPSSIA